MGNRVVMTGGRGRLGSELRGLHPEWISLNRPEFDLNDPESIRAALDEHSPATVVNAAAYTDVAGAEKDREGCWAVNVEGTLNLVRELQGRDCFLVHISTDYVFDGVRGGYAETDVPGPTRNYYALTKLAAEVAVRTLPHVLVLRTSFRPREWPYPTAFEDVYTSQDYVDVLASDMALAIKRCRDIPFDTLHIATERKSVYELAKRRKPDVQPGSKKDVAVSLPDDISLDVSRWAALKRSWEQE